MGNQEIMNPPNESPRVSVSPCLPFVSPARILFLLDKLTAAGTQTNLLEVVKGLDRTRFTPYVVALLGGGELSQSFREAGVELHELGVKKAYDLSGFKALLFLIRFMKEKNINVVQTHFLHADLLGTLAAKIAGVKTMITARRDEGFWRSPRQVLVNRTLNQFANLVLVNSEAVKRSVMAREKVSEERIQTIHNGVDTGKFYPSETMRRAARKQLGIQEDELAVGVVANMRHFVKGHRDFVEAISLILREKPQTKFLLVGEGRLRGELENLSEKLGVRSQVLFLGARQDTAALINAFDIACLPSHSEGFSNSLLEYMACAKPVVATRVGGNPEAVEDNVTGYLVPPRNPDVLAEKVIFLLRSESLRLEMGSAGRKRVLREFGVEGMVEKYEQLYGHGDRETRRHGDKNLTASPRPRVPASPPTPRRIMFVIWSLDLGGAEQVVIDLATKLDRQFFEPFVCCLNGKGRFAPQVEGLGIKVVALHKRPKFDPWVIFKLVRVMKKEKVDLVHTHLFTANLWGRIAAKLAGVPVVSSEHGMDIWRKRLHLTLDQMLTRVNRKIVFVSEGVKNFYKSRNHSLNGKGRVIHNGINIAQFQPRIDRQAVRKSLGLGESDKVVGIVGRLVPEKAHVDFIEAIEILRQEQEEIKGLIVGEGTLLGALQKRVKVAGLEHHVLFTGFRSDLPALYQAMDIFVMTSLREGFPLTILEAMAAGVPVIATAVGGVKECIEDGEDGLLIPPGDSTALAGAISRVLKDPSFAEFMIRNAKRKVQSHFSVERMVKEHESLYTEALAA